MRFVSVSFLFLVDDFDLSVSSVTRNRADQPIRPSACARQCPERHIKPLAGIYGNGTLVVLLLEGILPVWQPGVSPGLEFLSAGRMPAGPTAKMAVLLKIPMQGNMTNRTNCRNGTRQARST